MFNQQYWSAQYFDPVWFAPADESSVPEELLRKGGAPMFLPWWVTPYYRDVDEDELEAVDRAVDRAEMLAEMFPAKKQRKRVAKPVSRPAGERKAAEGITAPTEAQLVARAHAAAAKASEQAVDEIQRSVRAMEAEADAQRRQLMAAMLVFEMM